MKTGITATAMVLLAIMSMSHSLPLGSSSPEDAQPVIPLDEKPIVQELPALDIAAVREEEPKIEESESPKLEEKLEAPKPAEPEIKAIEDQASILRSAAAEEPKEVLVVPAVIKEEIEPVARSVEPEALPKVDEPAPIAEAEKPVAAEDAAKGLIAAIPDTIHEAEAKPKEEAEPVLIQEAPKVLRSEPTAVNEEEIAAIPEAEIKEEKIIPEYPETSQRLAADVVETVDQIIKEAEKIPAEEAKAAEISEAPKESEERSAAGSELAIEAQEEKKKEEEVKEVEKDKAEDAELSKKDEVKSEDVELPKKDEEKKEVELAKQEETKLEESSKPIKSEELPEPSKLTEADKLTEQSKKPEDNDSSEEDNSSEEKSSEKDKNAVKNEEDSNSSEQSKEDAAQDKTILVK